MDFVLFGTGLGATCMVLGWALRMFGPKARYQQDHDTVSHTTDLIKRMMWRQFASGLGAVIMTLGIVLVLVTFVLMLFSSGDALAAGVLVALALIGLALTAVWMWMFTARYGTTGLALFGNRERFPFSSEPAGEPAAHAPGKGDDVQPAGDAETAERVAARARRRRRAVTTAGDEAPQAPVVATAVPGSEGDLTETAERDELPVEANGSDQDDSTAAEPRVDEQDEDLSSEDDEKWNVLAESYAVEEERPTVTLPDRTNEDSADKPIERQENADAKNGDQLDDAEREEALASDVVPDDSAR